MSLTAEPHDELVLKGDPHGPEPVDQCREREYVDCSSCKTQDLEGGRGGEEGCGRKRKGS